MYFNTIIEFYSKEWRQCVVFHFAICLADYFQPPQIKHAFAIQNFFMKSKHSMSVWDESDQNMVENATDVNGNRSFKPCLVGLILGILCAGVVLAPIVTLFVKGKFLKN